MLRWLAYPFWNDAERRLRAAWRIALQLVVFALAWWAPQIGIARAKEAAVAHREGIFSQAGVYMVLTLAVLVSVWACARYLDRRPIDGVGLRGGRGFWIDLTFGVALGAMLMAGIAGAEVSFGLARYVEAPELPGEVPRWAYIPVAFYVFIAVAIIEELVFRGYHLTNLAEGLTNRWIGGALATLLAVLLSSVAFGLAHAGNPHASVLSSGNIVIAGVMLAIGYVLTGNLAIPIGLHLGWNFFQNLFDMPVSGQTFFSFGAVVEREMMPGAGDWVSGGAFGPEAGMTGLAAMMFGTFLILGWVRVRHGPLRVHPSFGQPPV